MQEYLDLGHMREVSNVKLLQEAAAASPWKVYYLPHHAVFKEFSTTTNVRVVFEGSARTYTGIKSNASERSRHSGRVTQIIFAGPIGFRQHEVVLVGDAEEMYRQVQVHVDDTSLQRVFFRFSADESIKLYQLSTVTYGLTSSSFLAIRALHQLAADEGVAYPEAAEAIIENFYVVD